MYKQRQGTIQANQRPSSQVLLPSKSKCIYVSSYLLAFWYRLASNFQTGPSLPKAEMTGMCHHAW